MFVSALACGRRCLLRSSQSALATASTNLSVTISSSSAPSLSSRSIFTSSFISPTLPSSHASAVAIPSAPTRSFHNPSRLRGVGPRPDQKSRRTRQIQAEKRRAALRTQLTGHSPILSPVRPQLPALLSLPATAPLSDAEAAALEASAVSLSVPVYSLSSPGAALNGATYDLPPLLFGAPIRLDILHRLVEWQRAGQRQGTAKTKDRGEVSGTGRKPHPQKGTGRARQGTKRAPHMRGGGVAHGKTPRDFSYSLPKKVRALGLRVALTVKHAQGRLRVMDDATLASHKTRHMAEAMQAMGVREFLFVHGSGELDANLALAARNLRHCDFLPSVGANVLSLLRHPTLLITRRAIDELQQRVERTMLRKSRVRYNVGSQGGGISYEEWKATDEARATGSADAAADEAPRQLQQQQAA